MARMQSQWNKAQKDGYQRANSFGRVHFWAGILTIAALASNNLTSSSAIISAEFHDFIEKLVAANNTRRFTAVDKNGENVLHISVKHIPLLSQTLDIFQVHRVDFNAVDEAGNSAFFNAVEYGRNASFLATLINYGVKWNTTNKNNDTALHVAASRGNLPAVNLLLSMGSDVNAQNIDLRTPLQLALLSPNVSQIPYRNVVGRLLHFGAKTTTLDVQTAKQGISEVVKPLFDPFKHRLTSPISKLDRLRWNSLKIERIFQIVQNEDLDLIKGVLEHVGNSTDLTEIWEKNALTHSLLHVAVKYRDYSVVDYLINEKDFNKKLNSPSFNAGLVALCMKNIHTVLPGAFDQKLLILQLLFSKIPDLIESSIAWRDKSHDTAVGTPLLYSAAHQFSNGKKLILITMLIANNANASFTTLDTNNTALQLAVRSNPLDPNIVQIIRILIENGADAYAVDSYGQTFLHLIAQKCTPTEFHGTVEFLDSINNTNSLLIPENSEEIVLRIAIFFMEVKKETLAIFKKRGYDFDFNKGVFRSLLQTAIYGRRSVSLLKNLIEFGADVNFKDTSGNTVLHDAVYYRNLEAVKLLIQYGAEVNVVNGMAHTPLHEVILADSNVSRLGIVSELVSHGANGNIQNYSGDFPIDTAQRKMEKGNLEDGIIELLVGPVLTKVKSHVKHLTTIQLNSRNLLTNLTSSTLIPLKLKEYIKLSVLKIWTQSEALFFTLERT